MYVCAYVCTYIHTHVYTHVCIYYNHIHLFTYPYLALFMETFGEVRLSKDMSACDEGGPKQGAPPSCGSTLPRSASDQSCAGAGRRCHSLSLETLKQ